MKQKYTSPEIEIIGFDTEDVITTSFGNGGGEMPDDGLNWSPLTPI
ncbi:hypothetical protein [Ruminococcus flavefaciens]|nr:hypothetical protein [Ruminococcus flavefaciens]